MPDWRDDVPQSFLCPITADLMVDPVMDREGRSYERWAIEEAIRVSGRSPISRSKLSVKSLRLNIALREAIEKWVSENLELINQGHNIN